MLRQILARITNHDIRLMLLMAVLVGVVGMLCMTDVRCHPRGGTDAPMGCEHPVTSGTVPLMMSVPVMWALVGEAR